MQVIVRCPAKINLGLRVFEPDMTGYHPIDTVFQAVGLFDELSAEIAEKDTSITSNWASLPAENTLTCCLQLAQESVALPPLRIHLTKQIPEQAGLGGGSSDAAGLLRALRKLLPNPIERDHEFEIAAAIGADVPFFLVGGRAKGEGYGERLSELPDSELSWYVIVQPASKVGTASAYRALDSLSLEKWDRQGLVNDFERVAPVDCLELKNELLNLGARQAMLCGSGSCVFGQFNRGSDAENAQMRLSPIAKQSWVVPSLTRAESLWTS